MALQVNVFMQNQPGRLAKMVHVMAEAGVNIRATTIASSEGFGVAKFLVDRPAEAAAALKAAGLSAALQSVVAVKMDDRAGGLDKILPLLSAQNVNVKDAYGFILARGSEAVFVFEVENPDETEKFLREGGCEVMTAYSLYGL
ncbi:MAG: ACT domain-containing protein [bacterium]